jgi:NADH dehydrogenase/NADH:ubiquinone oxidoreductase subunit G
MGALTLKSFPFELRGWDIEKFESIDPTDGFGSNTRVYISKDQVIQIEPDYNVHTFNTWLTDKGRQFFDGIFGSWPANSRKNKNNSIVKDSWTNIIEEITKVLYIFDHCTSQQNKNYFFNIIFENLSIEVLSLLILLSQKYSFVNLKRAERIKMDNDFESNFQLNATSNKIKLNSSNLCMLISNNPRYEGYYLNLNLRQRFFKGNFKCLLVGSIINITFPVSSLGSNLHVITTISEGNHLVCQDLKSSSNPILVINSELLKRNDGNNILVMIRALKHANILTNSWNGFNLLTPSLSEAGNQSISKFSPLTREDLLNFNSLYFSNIAFSNLSHIKKIIESKLLNYSSYGYKKRFADKKLFLDQNSNFGNNENIFNKLNLNSKEVNNYLYLTNTVFYENEDTFINTEGLIKRTNKLIYRKKTKGNWQILRKFLTQFKSKITFLNQKDNQIIFFNSKKINNFKTFLNFQYLATQSLTNLNFYLSIKTEPFMLNSNSAKFKTKTKKMNKTKVKYWLDDFFSGGKDEYSQNSIIMSNCSKILRTENTNFF